MTKDITLDTKLNTDPLYFTKEINLEDIQTELLELDIDPDFTKYVSAFNTGDIDTLEKLRLKHIEDARFKTHLQFVTKDTKPQDFKKVLDSHKKLLQSLGIKSATEFVRLLESGKTEKAKKFVKDLPKNDPNKKDLELLIDFI